MPEYDYDNWRPLTPLQARDLLDGLGCPWWIAGGWAIDLHLGRQTRDHHDLDVGVFACDQDRVQAYLSGRGWELHCADPPGQLRLWQPGEELPFAVHDIWCRRSSSGPWELQLMLNPGHGGHWVSRRDPAIRLSASRAILKSKDGVPYLAPAPQLHFKAKGGGVHDEGDLERGLPVLSEPDKADLARWVAGTYGPDHAWIARIRSAPR